MKTAKTLETEHIVSISALLMFLLLVGTGCASSPSATREAPPAVVTQGQFSLEAFNAPVVADLIRVGLETDVESIRFARTGESYLISPGNGQAWRTSRGFSIEAPVEGAAIRWTVQVASMAGSGSAEELAAELRDRGAGPTRVGFDGETGLYRVYAGDLETEVAAREARELLVEAGYPRDMFVTKRPTLENVPEKLTIVDDEGSRMVASSREVAIYPTGEEFVRVGDKAYRGAIIVRTNDRGFLNVINALGLEDYVRGVVPNEMGPRVYDQIAALGAQAIAARTYAISRMGQFGREGFDICATPACQVYGGQSTEHPLSDLAVRQTAGLIAVYDGKPIDALYTSTCGGHTSDVGVMFPGRNEPYLRSVDCVELEMGELPGRGSSAILDSMEMEARAFRHMASIREDARYNNRAIAGDVQTAADLGGSEVGDALLPEAVTRRAVLRYLGEALGFRLASERLLLDEDVRYFFPGVERILPEHRTAAFVNKYLQRPSQPIDDLDLDRALERDEFHALLFSWLSRQGMIQESRGKITGYTGGSLELELEGEVTSWPLSAGTPVYRELSDRYREHSRVAFLTGDRARVIHDRSNRPAAVIVQANYDGAAFDRTSSFSSWIRSYDADELTVAINRRKPIGKLARLEIAEIDPVGRVKRMLVTDQSGASFELAGLPVRWGLSVPDNLFYMQESRDSTGSLRYTFYGKGWGHGTGMCQVGAYGMAFAGKTSREIIEHYYTGAKVVSR